MDFIVEDIEVAPLIKSQMDMFGGEAPEVPNIPANPRADRMNNLSVDHKQIFNNLTKKQQNNSISSPERTHLTRFNQYLKGDISHDQLKNYVAYKQNENHTPLFGQANTTPEVPKVDVPPQPTVDNVPAAETPPTKVESEASDPIPPQAEDIKTPEDKPEKKFNYEVLKETEKAMHLKIPSWEPTDDSKKAHKQKHHELWIPKSVLAKGDDYAKQFALQAKEKIRTSNPYQKAFGKMSPHLRETLGEYAPIKEKKTRMVPDRDKAVEMMAEIGSRYGVPKGGLEQAINKGDIDISPEDEKLFNALRFTTDYDGNFKNDPLHPMKQQTYYEHKLSKSQLNMFEDEPKVDKIEAPKVADVKTPTEENFIKPEHELTSDNGTWKIKGDPAATAKMHNWIKDKYKSKDIHTYGGLMQSEHPMVDKIKELHGNNNGQIFDHYNKITGRESGKPSGVGENQLRMSMKDDGGLPIGDEHFKVPDLSREAKIERDSFPNGAALHEALNNKEVSPELHKWHKDYKFNSHHTNKATISEDNPLGKKYERSLYNKDTDSFGKIKQTKEDNLTPKDLEKYNSMKEKFSGKEYTDEHKARHNELTEKANKTYPLSDKFSPEDKEKYNRIQEDKEKFTRALQEKGITGKQKEAHQEVLDDLVHQESEMHNDYREKLGLDIGDQTGEKGFSYKQDLEPDEKTELEDLKGRKEFSRLDKQYNQAPEESHISKLLKYPMSSNQKIFEGAEDTEQEPEASKEQAMNYDAGKKPTPEVPKIDVSEKVNAPKPKKEKAPEVPQIDNIEDHFPTVGIRNMGSLQKTAREYGHRPEDSDKEYKPNSNVDFNGSKYTVLSDGGTYLRAKNLETGKEDTIAKNDLENYPTDKRLPVVYKNTVEDFMHQHGDKDMSLEDVYSGMGFPDDIQGKEHIKKKLKMALLQLEHNHETEEGHVPIVNREIGKPHPKEKDPKEKGIIYKLAKSIHKLATQNRLYVKSRNLIKSLMIELYPKEKNIYEKSIESKDILDSLMEWKEKEKSLSNWLDNIQATSIMKSGTNCLDISCHGLDETTNELSLIQSRFELLKSMDDGTFQNFVDDAVASGEEEESRTKYRLSKSYMQTEQFQNKLQEIENGEG